MEIENEKKFHFFDDDEIHRAPSVLIIFSFSGVRSSSVSSDKFVSLKGNMNASKVYATQAAFGDVSAKSMYSSLRLRSNSLEASKVSTIETVTPLIKVPKDSNGVRLYMFLSISEKNNSLTFCSITGFGARRLRLGDR